MTFVKSLAVVLALLLAPAVAAEERSTYTDPQYGFSLEVPALGDPAGVPAVQRLIVSGPRRDGFATNCNVQVQYPGMSHAEFVELSQRQFAAAGLRAGEPEPTKVSGLEATRLEYAGPANGRELHFLSIAVSQGERLILATCTVPEERLAAEREALLGVLASLRVEPRG
jgi:hypothetical protein